MKNMLLIFALVVACMNSQVAGATERSLSAVPTAWRLQDYMNGEIIIWYSGSACPVGRLTLSANAPGEVKSRFWSLIMSAKMNRSKVGIFYDDANCVITSFLFFEE